MATGGGTGGLARLIATVDRYGDAIEYDLHDRFGLDLLDFFRVQPDGRRRYSWRKLAVLIDQLPPGSAYWAARAGDVEAAEEVRKNNPDWKPKRKARPSLRDMSPGYQQLLGVQDLLATISAKLDLSNGAERAKVDPTPRPLFAMELAEAAEERRQLFDLVAEVDAAIARSAAAED